MTYYSACQKGEIGHSPQRVQKAHIVNVTVVSFCIIVLSLVLLYTLFVFYVPPVYCIMAELYSLCSQEITLKREREGKFKLNNYEATVKKDLGKSARKRIANGLYWRDYF